MRGLAGVLALLLGLLALAGCGGLRAADLFIVRRSGSGPHAALTLLVDEEGGVRCNGGPKLKLGDARLVRARAIEEELKDAASSKLALKARPGSVLAYSVRDQDGTVTFADNSTGQPRVLRELVLLVLETSQQVCRLPE